MAKLNARAAILICILFASGCALRFGLTRPSQKMSGVYHTVQKGETLWRISESYRVSIPAIREANGLRDDTIETGQRLLIPGAKKVRRTRPRPSVTPTAPERGAAPPKPAIIVKNRKADDSAGSYFIRPLSERAVSQDGNRKLVFEAEPGETVKAAKSGRVFFVGETRAYRSTLIIEHANGFYSIYGGDLEIAVEKGANVQQGATVGRMTPASKEKSLLYFEIRRGAEQVDPRAYFKDRRRAARQRPAVNCS